MADLPDDSQKKQDDQVMEKKPAGAKEQAEVGGKQEKTPITEYTRKVDIEPEVEGWLEKLEKEDTQLAQPVVDDAGQVILDEAGKKKTGFKVVLPLTKEEVQKGLHHKVIDSIRWLAEWCIRMIKMFGNKVAYRRK
jgi:hypothetical protein